MFFYLFWLEFFICHLKNIPSILFGTMSHFCKPNFTFLASFLAQKRLSRQALMGGSIMFRGQSKYKYLFSLSNSNYSTNVYKFLIPLPEVHKESVEMNNNCCYCVLVNIADPDPSSHGQAIILYLPVGHWWPDVWPVLSKRLCLASISTLCGQHCVTGPETLTETGTVFKKSPPDT